MGSLAAFLLVVGRLGYLQIYCHAELMQRAERERAHPQMDAPRGTIFDRSGHVLALSIGGGSCFADPKHIKNAGSVARALSPLLNIPAHTLEAKLTQENRREQTRARKRETRLKIIAGAVLLADVAAGKTPRVQVTEMFKRGATRESDIELLHEEGWL